MSRHVTALGGDLYNDRMWLDTETLSILVDRMTQLRELHCCLALPVQPTAFPAQLRHLDICFTRPVDAVQVNASIAAIGHLLLLEELEIVVSTLDRRVSFATLVALPLLRSLRVWWQWDESELSKGQVDQLRSLPQLQEVNVKMSTPQLRRLLRQPHDLQWQKIRVPESFDDETAALLPLLPSLTQINGVVTCARFDWLSGLPNLTEVQLSFDWPDGAVTVDRAESLVAGLQCCSQLEDLTLFSKELTDVHLAELLL